MLAEKFFLVLETLRSNAQDDGAVRVVSTSSPHIAIDLPATRSDHDRRDEPRRDSQQATRAFSVLIKSEPKL
jgi:hypothetical protein